ncbi:nicotinamide riboside transporter PnuC [Flavimarina sp. Hel_I_48]|uniref:nicotinamide riboside transporter PnuC n=1 Tax=Flavimarina sp. Hel_I_48 TaxID=1392488 RepID=UPI0004DF6714|nr:nicotinamide riboside transporter PnuC [Flavimarina sp. Hel_I_48]
MSEFFEFFFDQYATYSTINIVLEIVAVIFGLLSVIFSMRNNIFVYPTGMISTAIFVYLLLFWGLLGDMMINGYYFVMSIYGWWVWTRKVDPQHVTPIARTTKKEHAISAVIFVGTIGFVALIYTLFDKWESWVSWVDTLTTAIFFVGMWLMARRKIENWIYWIVGDIISAPLYFHKGLTFTSLQYLIFTVIALFGYIAWKKNLDKNPVIA